MKRLALFLCLISLQAFGQEITQLPQASIPYSGSEIFPCVQGLTTKQCKIGNISGGGGTGNITGPGSSTVGYAPLWSNSLGTALGIGLPVATTGNSTIVQTSPSGVLSTGILPLATASSVGVVEPDNVTTTVSDGVLSVAAGALPTLANDKFWLGNGSNVATAVTMSGDATLANTGALTLANSGVSAGSYTLPNVTVNAKGLVTSISNGSSSGCTAGAAYCVGWYNVVSYGADPTNTNDSTGGISQAIAAAAGSTFGGGTVYVPAGIYKAAWINIPSGSVLKINLEGDGINTTRFVPTYAPVTISIATPAVVTLNNHGLTAGYPVIFSTTGALPTGITAGTVYYVISTGLTTNSFEISTSVGGAAVNTSGSQSGTQSAIGKNFLTVAGNESVVRNLMIVPNATMPAGGDGIYINSGSVDLDYVYLAGAGAGTSNFFYNGIHLDASNAYQATINNSGVTGASAALIVLGDAVSTANGATGVFNNVQMGCGTSSPGSGILVYTTGGLQVTNSSVLTCTHGFITYPGSGQNPFAIFLLGFSSDTTGSDGIAIYSNGGTVTDVEIDNSWGSSSTGTGNGLAIVGSGVNGVAVNGGQYINNAADGILINGATNVQINGPMVYGNSTSGSAYYNGIAVAANTSNFQISGVVSGYGGYPYANSWGNKQSYGVFVASGTSNHYNIINNNLPGNVTGTLLDGGSGTDKTICGNLPGGTSCGGSASGVSSLIAGANINVSSSTGNVTVSVPASFSTANITATSTMTIPQNVFLQTSTGQNLIDGTSSNQIGLGYTGASNITVFTSLLPYNNNGLALGYPGSVWQETFTQALDITGITGSTQCLQANSSGVVSGSGNPCGGAVSSVSNSDGSLTISPTTGSVVASINTGHNNSWSGTQTFTNITVTGTPTFPNNTWLTTASGYNMIEGNSSGVNLGYSGMSALAMFGNIVVPAINGSQNLGFPGNIWAGIYGTSYYAGPGSTAGVSCGPALPTSSHTTVMGLTTVC